MRALYGVAMLQVGFTGKKIPASNWAAAFVALIGVGLLTTSGGDFSAGDAWYGPTKASLPIPHFPLAYLCIVYMEGA